MKRRDKFWVETRCNSWKSFWSQIQGLPGIPEYDWIFRGQANSGWRLEPTIERGFGTKNIAERECELYEGFHAKAHLYSSRLPLPNDHLSWIGMMQHHGCPTRLLDWTYSPLVATYFALADSHPEPYSAVWAISTGRLKNEEWWIGQGPISSNSQLKVALDQQLTRVCTAGNQSLVRLCTPGFESQRISSQQGCFLYNCNLAESFEASLNGMMGSDDGWAYKFLIPRSSREEFLRKLLWMNVHAVSLFPDLDGLSRFLKMKSELVGF